MAIKTYKVKLYQAKKNKYLHRQIDVAGLIYNHCIALHRRYYKLTGKSLNQYELMKHLTKLKRLPKCGSTSSIRIEQAGENLASPL